MRVSKAVLSDEEVAERIRADMSDQPEETVTDRVAVVLSERAAHAAVLQAEYDGKAGSEFATKSLPVADGILATYTVPKD
jgi:hypothetical protein